MNDYLCSSLFREFSFPEKVSYVLLHDPHYFPAIFHQGQFCCYSSKSKKETEKVTFIFIVLKYIIIFAIWNADDVEK